MRTARRSSTRSLLMSTLLIAPLPVSVSVPSGGDGDSVETDTGAGTTSLKFGGGHGSYERNMYAAFSSSGCGRRRVPINYGVTYTDFGAEIDHQVEGVTHVGLRGGVISEIATLDSDLTTDEADIPGGFALPPRTTGNVDVYFNPYISWEGKWIGGGVGLLVSSGHLWTGSEEEYRPGGGTTRPSGHLRVGERSGAYLSASTGESVPIYSGGGIYNYGLGVMPAGELLDLWVGKARGPWSESVLFLKVGVRASPHWSIRGNVWFDEGRSVEGGVGLTRRFGE